MNECAFFVFVVINKIYFSRSITITPGHVLFLQRRFKPPLELLAALVDLITPTKRKAAPKKRRKVAEIDVDDNDDKAKEAREKVFFCFCLVRILIYM